MRLAVAQLAAMCLGFVSLCAPVQLHAAPDQSRGSRPTATVGQLVAAIRAKAQFFESSSGMRDAFQSFLSRHKLPPGSVRYSDFVTVRLVFEAARDAGFWNLHWSITNEPPNSDQIWQQWKDIARPSPLTPTATAECDELSALYAFLVERAGVRSVGLLWPYPNHTVAVWCVHPTGHPALRIVVPTSQIFLEPTDYFDTTKFDPWRQKTIYEYTRRDVSDSFEIPTALYDFFLRQIDRYAGASDVTLQQLRYFREGVFRGSWTPEAAAREALARRGALHSAPAEDPAAYWNFAEDMRSVPTYQALVWQRFRPASHRD